LLRAGSPPAGENAGVRDDAVYERGKFKPELLSGIEIKSLHLMSIFSVRDDYRMNDRKINDPARKAVLLARTPL
jgi:hypothetical protein